MSLSLGYPHYDYLLPYLDANQLRDWEIFYQENGLGVARNDIHWGMLMSLIANCHRDSNKPPLRPTQFMAYYDPLKQEVTKEQFRNNLRSILPSTKLNKVDGHNSNTRSECQR